MWREDTQFSASDTAAGTGGDGNVSIFYAAGTSSNKHGIKGFSWSYSAAPTGGGVVILDGATTVKQYDITAAGPGFIHFPGVMWNSAGNSLTITLLDGGGGCNNKINCDGHLER
jgi:hypothetical protein